MSGPGRPTLCKPEHAGRARALCARRGANPDRARHRERILWVRQQNGRRKGREGRKPRILGKQGPFQCWREAAETGGNWRKPVVLSGPRFDPLLQRAGVVNFWGSETMISAFP
jgi:hypothetical protein